MTLIPTRRTIALVGATLAATALPALAATSSASAADGDLTTYQKSLTYTCDVTTTYGGGFVLDDVPVTANISFTTPYLKPDTRLAPIDVDVDLDLGEDLRDASTGLLESVQADGQSTNVTLAIKDSSGSQRTYRIPKLAAPKTDIPVEKGAPFIVPATGKTPTIYIPARSSITAIAPLHFDVDANLYDAKGESQPIELSCDDEGDRTVATIPVGVTPQITAKVEPGIVKAGATDTTVLVKTTSPIRATGSVYLSTESGKTVGYADLNKTGNVRIKLDPYYKTGRRTLVVDYLGDKENVRVQTRTKFSVVE